jgi:glucose-1-phosphate cytidylyltransferase
MKVVILAGGLGTRLSEYTNLIPKPMVPINGEPILKHVMKCFYNYGYKDFIIALGYKGDLIRKYFSDNLEKDELIASSNISMIDTGEKSLTGGRIKRLEGYIDDKFFLTYGDGVANVNISSLVNFHIAKGKVATVTAVRPIPRFGALEIENDMVQSFSEKDQVKEGWINGGFFVFEKNIFSYLKDDFSILERDPLETLSSEGNLAAYKHNGFWQCMDTKRDKEVLEEFSKKEKIPPWHKKIP